MNCDPATTLLWNVDPVLIRWGAIEFRYYSAFFLLVCITGYALWQPRMVRGGYTATVASRLIPYAVFGIVAGGRLVHCLFYEPAYYLEHPWQILDIRRGGLASHGSVVGLFVMFVIYTRVYRIGLLEACDRFAISAMFGASFVRLGNFFNSEIVGLEWCGPWAVRFARFAASNQSAYERVHGSLGWSAEPLPRHPAQLYEWVGMLLIAGVLYAVDRRRGEAAPRGEQIGLLFVLYFTFRIALESAKEFQRFARLEPDAVLEVIRVVPTGAATMGQWLSVPFVAIGLVLLARAWSHTGRTGG